MSAANLGRADLSLWTDPSQKVYIPRLRAMPRRRSRAGALVQFAGDEFPTAFRGEARSGQFDLTCYYGVGERALAVALVHLIDEVAPGSFDSRLLLRTHLEPTAGLTAPQLEWLAAGAAVAVQVFDVTETPVEALGIEVSFTAQVVQHSYSA